MLDGLREAMVEHNIDNVEVVQGRRAGGGAGERPSAAALSADVTLIAHVGYDVDAIWPFLEAMERVTCRECLAVLMERIRRRSRNRSGPKSTGSRESRSRPCPRFVDPRSARPRPRTSGCSN